MAVTRPEPSSELALSVSASAGRALIRELGATAWTVLVDVNLDAWAEPAGRTATTSVRLIADHLGLTPGTVARALARLTAAELVQRQDRRDGATGRFVESVYIVAPTAGIVPCVDCPHTAQPHTAGWPAPATNRRDDDAGQRLPEGMASVCRTLSGGGRAGGGGGSANGREGEGERGGRGRRPEDGRAREEGVGGDQHGADRWGVRSAGVRPC
jgi:DNA-binding transcriptional ArsR family regulator